MQQNQIKIGQPQDNIWNYLALYEPPQGNPTICHMWTVKAHLRSLIRAFTRFAVYFLQGLDIMKGNSEGCDQTEWICRLVWAFIICTCLLVGFPMLRLVVYLDPDVSTFIMTLTSHKSRIYQCNVRFSP